MPLLKYKTIAIFGYGSQGEAQAKNLRDSGFNVIIGARKKHNSWKKAKKDKFKVYEFTEAAKKADLIHFLITDPIQGKVFSELKKEIDFTNKTLCFSSGYSITFKLIIPPKKCDVIMVAPIGPGKKLRKNFLEKKPMNGLLAVEQDFSGKAKNHCLELAKAIGLKKIYWTSFKEEAIANLFSEQCFLCGGLSELGKNVFNEMVKAKISPEVSYQFTFKGINLLAELLSNYGIEGMYSRVSDTAEFGSRKNASKLFGKEFKKNLSKTMSEITKGNFTKEWQKEFFSGKKKLNKMRLTEKNSLIERQEK